MNSPQTFGRLNAFQRVMLAYSELHPYNAVHIYQLAGPLQADALQEALSETCRANGLGQVEVDRRAGQYRYLAPETAPGPEIAVLSAGEDLEGQVSTRVTVELNRPFARPRAYPFRLSAVAGDGQHVVLFTYDHWIADSVGARLIMRQVLGRYLRASNKTGTGAEPDNVCSRRAVRNEAPVPLLLDVLGGDVPENAAPLELYPPTYRQAFAQHFRGWRRFRVVAQVLAHWWRHRRAWQVPFTPEDDIATGFLHYTLPPDLLPRLHSFARRHELSIHDVFLAVLARTLSAAALRRDARPTPNVLTLGTIVDTRAEAQLPAADTLGLFLGNYMVRTPLCAADDLVELAQRISQTTRQVKQQKGFLASNVGFGLFNLIWPWVPKSRRAQHAREILPMSGGITNVVVRDEWMLTEDRILGFARAASCGPALPLVISPTTLRKQLNLCVTYRTAGFRHAEVEEIVAGIRAALDRIPA